MIGQCMAHDTHDTFMQPPCTLVVNKNQLERSCTMYWTRRKSLMRDRLHSHLVCVLARI